MPPITQQFGDDDRLQTYQLLLTIDNQLRTMSIDLKDVIKRLNDTNVNLNDPVSNFLASITSNQYKNLRMILYL